MDALYTALRTVLRPALARGFEWVLEGEEHVPVAGGVVVAANHISYLDALCLAYLADQRNRRVRFLAKASFFDVPVFGAVLRAVGDIPAGRRRHDPPGDRGSALDAAVAELSAGHCIGIFPEGRISRDLEPQKPHTGVARLAAAAAVPVVPTGLWGGQRLWTRGHRPQVRPGLPQVVVAGPPLVVGADEDPHEATDRIMAAVCACVADARRRYPERPPPGQQAWWHREPDTARLRSCER